MLDYLATIIHRFILRLLNGEGLAFAQFIIFLAIAYYANLVWQHISRSEFFKVALVVLACLIGFGFLFIPERMLAIVDRISYELTKPYAGQ